MQLTDEQKQLVSGWVKEGCGLSEVQKRLSSELGISMTYMDVRFLVLDLNLELKDKPTPKTRKEPEEEPPAAVASEFDAADGDSSAVDPGAGGVRITVDRLMKPGALVSGEVTFSDGVSGSWSLDQFGRLALDTGSPAYRPSQEDLLEFQAGLQQALARRGF